MKDDPMRRIKGGKRQLTGGNISSVQFQTSWPVFCSLVQSSPCFSLVSVSCFFALTLESTVNDVPFSKQAVRQFRQPCH